MTKTTGKLIQSFLSEKENGWLEFKQKMYQVYHSDKKVAGWQKNELVRDILSLANGNIFSVDKTAYLIIGVEDELNAHGLRDLFDIEPIDLSRKQILEWVNAVSEPKLEYLNTEYIFVDGKRLFVITVHPSPYVYRITRTLKTKKNKQYSAQTVFIRIGEAIEPASPKQVQALEKAKKQTSTHIPTWLFVAFGTILGSLLLGDLNWEIILPAAPNSKIFIQALGLQKAILWARIIAIVSGGLIGGGAAWTVVAGRRLINNLSRETSEQRRAMMVTAILVIVVCFVLIKFYFS